MTYCLELLTKIKQDTGLKVVKSHYFAEGICARIEFKDQVYAITLIPFSKRKEK